MSPGSGDGAMTRHKKTLTPYDVDTGEVSEAFRRLADGIDDGDVMVQRLRSTHDTNISVDDADGEAAEGESVFGLEMRFFLTHAYADVADTIRYNTDAYLRFADHIVDQILAGKKTATVRYGLERHFDRGETVALIDEVGDEFARATVGYVYRMPVRDVIRFEVAHYAGHSVDFLVERLRELYDTDAIDADTEVVVITFDGVEGNDDYSKPRHENE